MSGNSNYTYGSTMQIRLFHISMPVFVCYAETTVKQITIDLFYTQRGREACLTTIESKGYQAVKSWATNKVRCCRIVHHVSLFPWTSESRCEP